MRPLPGRVAATSLGAKATAEANDSPPAPALQQQQQPTTFFLTSQSDLNNNSHAAASASVHDSTYGVQSLDEGHQDEHDTSDLGDPRATGIASPVGDPHTTMSYTRLQHEESLDSLATSSLRSSPGSSPSRRRLLRQLVDLSRPLTPFSNLSPTQDSSIPSTPQSAGSQTHLALEATSNALQGESTLVDTNPDLSSLMTPLAVSSSAPPQLIMPSILMPVRRPFTENGRRLGRLKILLAGAAGVGKTSLIKSLVQTCPDIVHVDSPIVALSTSSFDGKSRRRLPNRSAHTEDVLEISASTKAYPTWWSEIEGAGLMSRRSSAPDAVLDRNVCFVDTPGFDPAGTSMAEMESILDYIRSQMDKAVHLDKLPDADLQRLLGGSGGPYVDLVLYLASQVLAPAEIAHLQQLHQLTNVAVVIAKIDTLEAEERAGMQRTITEQLESHGLLSFKLATVDKAASALPYLTCSSPSSALEHMDASLLMQSDYIQPLHPSDLDHLASDLFHPESLEHLKHASARKIVQYRSRSRAPMDTLSSPRTSLPPAYLRSNSTPLQGMRSQRSQGWSHGGAGALTYAQSGVRDHTYREERLARVQLAQWATSLQRSLQQERMRFEAIAQAEQAAWLQERLQECAKSTDTKLETDGALATVGSPRSKTGRRWSGKSWPRIDRTQASDPLGLVQWTDAAAQHGWTVAKTVGKIALIGALTVWVAQSLGWSESSWERWI